MDNKMRIFTNRAGFKKKKHNKAQTTIFVIVGVIIVIAVIIGFFVYNKIKKSKIEEETKKAGELSFQAGEVKKFINDCIRKESFDGLKLLAQSGGYLDVPNLISFKGTAMWQIDQANTQPFLNQTQARLTDYINSNTPKCIENENLTKFGFQIEKSMPTTFIEFGSSDVTIKVVYPIKISKGDFTKEFSEFFNTFDIRYRATFEAATEVNEKLFDADFEVINPLKKLDYLKNLDFDVDYRIPETDIMTFTVTDKKSVTPTNEFYSFNFAAKLGKSSLKRVTDMQNNSASNPTFLPYTIFSVDKKAQLDISSGTAISLNGQSVPSIIVQQSYPPNVVTKNVPVEKENKEIKRREDLTYVIDNPIYNFKPDGLLFNKLQKLTIYYDDPQGKDAKGVGMLKGKKNPATGDEFWVPIPSQEDRANRKVFAAILGFTDFTAIFCQSQQLKKVVARQVFEPNTGCYVTLALLVLSIALSILTFGITFGFFTTLYGMLTGTVAITFSTAVVSVILTLLSVTLGIVGTATEAFYTSSPENCQGFVPTCTWQVGIDVVEKDGEGKCIPESGTYQAGVPVVLCAQVQKCNFIEKFTCQKCSVECTAQFY